MPPEPTDPGLEALAAAWREGTRRSPGVVCVERTLVVRAARGEVSVAERERVADHLGHCADCSDAWRAAKVLAPVLGSAAGAHRSGLAPIVGLAATLAITAIGLGWWLGSADSRDSSSVRGGGPTLVEHGDANGVAAFATPPRQLVLPPGEAPPAGLPLELVLSDATASPIWVSPPRVDTTFELPPTLELAPGTYLWRVRSTNGLEPWQSRLHRFRIGVAVE